MLRVFKKFKDLLDVSWAGSEGKFWKTKADGSGLEAVTISIPNSPDDIGAQELLISGVNIKTINDISILGVGNITIVGGGDVVGPALSTDGNIVLFNGTSGKQVKDIGAKLSDFATASHNHSGVYAPVLGIDDYYVTEAEKTKLANLSGVNTGDQDLSALNAHLLDVSDPHNTLFDQLGGTLTKLPLNTTAGATVNTGELAWNADERTVDLGLNGVTLQVGQEIVVNVRNTTGATITNGTVCMATGTIGGSGRITVAPMDGTNPNNAMFLLGVATEDIPTDSDGFVTVFGKIRGVDTSSFVKGDVLYTSTTFPGKFTKVAPTSGLKQPIAYVISAAINGVLFVRIETLNHLGFAPALDINDKYVTSAEKAALNGVETISGVLIGSDPTIAQAISALDSALTVTTYLPSGVSVSGTNSWTLLSGVVSDLNVLGGNTVTYQEGTGTNQIVEVNWDNVTDWNKLHFHYRYYSVSAASIHTVNFEIYNVQTSQWESILSPIVNNSSTLELVSWTTDHGADYVTQDTNKRVRVRLIHVSNGNTSHRLELEHCILQHGLIVGDAITSHAGLGGRSLSNQHPASAITFTPTGNLSSSNLQAAIEELDSEKQASLISGTNLKTINGTSLLGAGDLAINASGSLLVAETVVSGSAVTSITFSGLDGNAHGGYILEILPAYQAAVSFSMKLRYNGSTIDGNYSRLYWNYGTLNGGPIQAVDTNSTCVSYNQDTRAYMQVHISLASGYPIARAFSQYFKSGSNSIDMENYVVRCAENISNITSIDIIATSANAIAVGSIFRLYKRK